MLEILIIIIYSALFCIFIAKTSLFKVKDLSLLFICMAFFIKIGVGILYGYLHHFYFAGGDTIDYFNSAEQISSTFFKYPSYYFRSWFWMNPEMPDNSVFYYPEWSFIKKDFGTYLLVHVHALPQLLCFGYYNVHIVFVALLSLLSSLNFYRALRDTINLPKSFLIFSCFFMPSVLFWTAGLHKDVWVYFGFSLLMLSLRKLVLHKKIAIPELFSGIIIIALFRYYLILLIFPALLAIMWSVLNLKKSPLFKFIVAYSVFLTIMLLVELLGIFPIMELLSSRQHEFLSETGNSGIAGAQELRPTFLSMLSQLPYAIINVCFRPFIWDCNDLLQYVAAFEIIIFWFFVIVSLPYRRTDKAANSMSYFLFFYSVTNLLLIGMLVCNVGTIVRYRSIALSMLFVVVMQAFDYIKLGIRKRQLNKPSSVKRSNNNSAAINSNL
jgi:hypothetical protein